MKKWTFKNFTIKRKLFTTLVLCVIIPMIMLGGFFSFWMMQQEQDHQNNMELEIIKQVHQDLDAIFYDVEDMTVNLLINPWAQKAVLGTAINKDFWEMKEWYANATRNKNYFGSMVLSNDGQIVFQRGTLIEGEQAAFLNQVQKEQDNRFWTTPYQQDTYHSITKIPQMVLSYYLEVVISEDARATLSVSIPEKELRKTMETYLQNRVVDARLLNEDGVILSSMKEAEVGQDYVDFKRLIPQMQGESGFFKIDTDQGKVLVLYAHSDKTDHYLISTKPSENAVSVGVRYFYGIFLAVFLCGLFGIVFTKIQSRYMIKPLEGVAHEFEKVKQGDFSIQLVYDSEDEIGIISKEFVNVSQRIKELIDEVYLSKIFNQEAELQLLTSQINPHFLYNTLDSIHWLAIKDKNYKVAEQIEALADIFRHVLSRGQDMVTLSEEVTSIKQYMLIMNARYGERAKLTIEVEDELLEVTLPKLILQPLVENAMMHGLEPKLDGGMIKVSARKKGNNMHIVVSDDGVGSDAEVIVEQINSEEESYNVYALKNLKKRIELKYGTDAKFEYQSEVNVGTKVEIIIPLNCGGKGQIDESINN